MWPGRAISCSLNEIIKRQREGFGDSCDDRESRIRALSLLDLRQRLNRNLSAEGEFGARQSSLDAGLPQDDSHCAPQIFTRPDRAPWASRR